MTIESRIGLPGNIGYDICVVIPFGYDTETYTAIQPVSRNDVLEKVSVLIIEEFDGVGANLSMGKGGSPAEYLYVSPMVVGQYENTEMHRYTQGEYLSMTINNNGSTQGRGILLYRVKSGNALPVVLG